MSGTEEYPKFPLMNAMFATTHTEPTHRTEAEALIGADWGDSHTTNALLEGMLRATLYLADQQRVANLIAFEALTGEKNRAEIRKGLEL